MTRALLAVLAHPDDESFGPGGTLAKYAREGVDVHICIATDGAAGSLADGFGDKREEIVPLRASELEKAVAVLGGTLHRLGYRDSGMRGSADNDHPDAFINSADSDAVSRVVALIRHIRPQVVITHDETGGYYHPDHIRCYEVVTAAFHAAGDPAAYPADGLPPFQPERLYYTAFSNRWLKLFSLILRLRGRDPQRAGRNGDIDLTRLGYPPELLQAHVNVRRYWDVKREASAAHASQGGGMPRSRFLPEWLMRRLVPYESFIRAFPPLPAGTRVRDLFE